MSSKTLQRRQAILELTQAVGHAQINALCSHFGVSEPTIRRDLASLVEQGLVMRTYGGAATHPTRHEIETPLEQRRSQCSQRKAEIAQAAAGLVADGETLLLDGGTTIEALAQALRCHKNLTIYTVNLFALSALANLPDARIHILGGKVRLASMSTLGSQTLAALSRITVDRAFLSADGVVANYGLCEASPEQAWLKQCMADRATEVSVLADSSKLGMASQQHWTKFSRPWMLITDSGANAEQLEQFRSQTMISLLIAPMEVSAG
ncbi:MAG: DeoR/GlpR transcriptional regulator [Rhodoferax sp.]|uniref:DeoR/GlpR family DNA-binding transcription regulator n=1 Tax=Rhodoferax sp. TaxID=50421 RepID=UPI0013FFC656|nr:DeoR/GlpR family DNA-binding transcription regulator [Rhodoferax sp.]NDP38406.1 DeoR/GlpR transcriptional regulator [Rhodoferax sp.]